MQLRERIEACNGCAACVVGCKYVCVKMEEADGKVKKLPLVDENGCSKCNACVLFCPLYNPVELPVFEEFYAYDPAFAGNHAQRQGRAAYGVCRYAVRDRGTQIAFR